MTNIHGGVNIDYKHAVKMFLELNPRKLNVSNLITISIHVSLMKYNDAVSSCISVIIFSV